MPKTYTILVDIPERRIQLIPVQTIGGGWTYRVAEMDGTEIDEEPQFTSATPSEFDDDIQQVYGDPMWDLRVE